MKITTDIDCFHIVVNNNINLFSERSIQTIKYSKHLILFAYVLTCKVEKMSELRHHKNVALCSVIADKEMSEFRSL